MTEKEQAIYWRLNEHKEIVGEKYLPRNVMCVSLHGSQRYGSDIETSDIDSKALLIPSMPQVMLHEDFVSKEIETVCGEHICAQDFRLIFNSFMKCNPNFLEIISDEYSVVNDLWEPEWGLLVAYRDDIANCQPHRLMKAIRGAADQQYKKFENEHLLCFDDDLGYSPKSLVHTFRLREVMKTFVNTKDFYNAIDTRYASDYLRSLRTAPLDYAAAKTLCIENMKYIDEMYKRGESKFSDDAPEIGRRILDRIIIDALRRRFAECI